MCTDVNVIHSVIICWLIFFQVSFVIDTHLVIVSKLFFSI